MGLEIRNPALGGRRARENELLAGGLNCEDSPSTPSTARLRLVETRNDDGHFSGLEPCWTPLGYAAARVVARAVRAAI
jgi:hypothetical protein